MRVYKELSVVILKQVLWLTLVILLLERQRKNDQEFKINLSYIEVVNNI